MNDELFEFTMPVPTTKEERAEKYYKYKTLVQHGRTKQATKLLNELRFRERLNIGLPTM